MAELVGWSIEGSFITKIVREWFWIEHKPYSTCAELLTKGFTYEGLSEHEIDEFARKVISGELKLVGSDTIRIEEDSYSGGFDLTIESMAATIFKLQEDNRRLKAENMELNEQLAEVRGSFIGTLSDCENLRETRDDLTAQVESFSGNVDVSCNITADASNPVYRMQVELGGKNFIDSYTWEGIFKEPDESVKEEFNALCENCNLFPVNRSYGDWSYITFSDKDSEAMLSADELLERGFAIQDNGEKHQRLIPNPIINDHSSGETEENQPYGWLSPTGIFTPGDWGEHEGVAYDIINEKGWMDEYEDWDDPSGMDLARDFLVMVKGYVLLDNPSRVGRTRVTKFKPLTKYQREFLYDYFMKEGDTFLANHFFNNEI